MRNLSEAKAEIFRLSEKKIAERKKNLRRTAAFCIPICLFLTVFSATALQKTLLVPQDKITECTDGESTDKTPEGTAGDIEMPTDTTPPNTEENADTDIQFGVNDIPTGGNIPSTPPGNSSSEPPSPADSPIPANFRFSITWGTYGISSYDSASGTLIKSSDATNPEDYVTSYSLNTAAREQIYNVLKALDISSYPDVYDPHGGKLTSDPSMTLILSVKMGSVEKTVTAEDIALTYEADNLKGQNFLDTCRVITNILTSADEWNSLPEYEFFYD